MSDNFIVLAAILSSFLGFYLVFRVSIWLTDRKSTEKLALKANKVDDTRSINDGFIF